MGRAVAGPGVIGEVHAELLRVRLTRDVVYVQGAAGARDFFDAAAALVEAEQAVGLPQIVVTNGALAATSIVTRAVLSVGDRVLVESPSYPNTLAGLRRAATRLVTAPVDPEGWDTDALRVTIRQGAPTAAVLVPDFHNPTGALMPDEQRAAVGAALTASGVITVVDETLAEMALDDVANVLFGNLNHFREQPNGPIQILAVLAQDRDVEGVAVLDEQPIVTVEHHAARRPQRQQTLVVVLRHLGEALVAHRCQAQRAGHLARAELPLAQPHLFVEPLAQSGRLPDVELERLESTKLGAGALERSFGLRGLAQLAH